MRSLRLMYFLDLDCSLQEWWSADASSCAGTRTRSGEFELVDAMLEQLTVSFPLQYIRTHLHRLCGACSISRPSPGPSRTRPAAPTRCLSLCQDRALGRRKVQRSIPYTARWSPICARLHRLSPLQGFSRRAGRGWDAGSADTASCRGVLCLMQHAGGA